MKILGLIIPVTGMAIVFIMLMLGKIILQKLDFVIDKKLNNLFHETEELNESVNELREE